MISSVLLTAKYNPQFALEFVHHFTENLIDLAVGQGPISRPEQESDPESGGPRWQIAAFVYVKSPNRF
jgi:hypothetical protein